MPGEEKLEEATSQVPGEEKLDEATSQVPGEEKLDEATSQVPGEGKLDEATSQLPDEEKLVEAGEALPEDAKSKVDGVEDEHPEEEVPAEVPLDLSILKGKKVNKLGKIVDEEGTPFGQLAEGYEAKKLVGKKVDAEGNIWDDSGMFISLFLPFETLCLGLF